MARKSDPAVDLAVADYRRGVFTSFKAAAKAYNVSQSTVRDRYHGKPTRQQGHAHRQLLSPVQEKLLVQWALDLELCGQAPTHTQLKTMASVISQASGGTAIVSDRWALKFKRRNPEVHTKQGVALDHKCA